MISVAITTGEAAALRKLIDSQRSGSEQLRFARTAVSDATLSWNEHEQGSVAEAIALQADQQVSRGFTTGVWIDLSARLAEVTGDASFRWDWKPVLSTAVIRF